MRCKDIIEFLDAVTPREYAETWDNIGLLVGDSENEIKKIMIAVDATDKVVETACESGVDLLITHHPLILKGMKQVNEQDFIGRRVRKLIKSDICCYAMHTNFDIAGNMAGLAADRLGIINTSVLEETKDGKGIGTIGDLKENMTIWELAEFVKRQFSLETVLVYGELEKTVRRVAVSPGSGRRGIPFAVQQSADILITGDIGYHEGIEAEAMGLTIMDAGHYGLEKIFVSFMCNFLKENLSEELEFLTETLRNPFTVI